MEIEGERKAKTKISFLVWTTGWAVLPFTEPEDRGEGLGGRNTQRFMFPQDIQVVV